MSAHYLSPVAIEEIEGLVKQAQAVAQLIVVDVDAEDVIKNATGAMLICLGKARAILEGKDKEVSHG